MIEISFSSLPISICISFILSVKMLHFSIDQTIICLLSVVHSRPKSRTEKNNNLNIMIWTIQLYNEISMFDKDSLVCLYYLSFNEYLSNIRFDDNNPKRVFTNCINNTSTMWNILIYSTTEMDKWNGRTKWHYVLHLNKELLPGPSKTLLLAAPH